MKDKGYARQVDRGQLTRGAEEVGVSLEEHATNAIAGLKTIRETLGL
jgi:predicted hydrolase (HD superfamily)